MSIENEHDYINQYSEISLGNKILAKSSTQGPNRLPAIVAYMLLFCDCFIQLFESDKMKNKVKIQSNFKENVFNFKQKGYSTTMLSL
jgi:hypothetical protein